MAPINAIITMAGFGRRFLDAGYKVPKYMIVAHERSLFAWSMLSLRSFIENSAHLVFVVRAADAAGDFIRSEASGLGANSYAVVEIDAPTDGQATTAMLAADAVSAPDAPILIYNIDTFVHPSALPVPAVRGAGWIPCFPAQGDAWSFVDVDDEGRAREVREKQRISNHATIGLYYFASFNLYEETYRNHYSDAANIEAGERYVAPIYNTMIKDGADVYIHDVDKRAVIPLGVPADLESFLSRPPPNL